MNAVSDSASRAAASKPAAGIVGGLAGGLVLEGRASGPFSNNRADLVARHPDRLGRRNLWASAHWPLPITGTAVGLGAAGDLGARGAGVRMVAALGAGLIFVYSIVGVAAGQIDRVVEGILRHYAGTGYVVIGIVLVGLGGWLLLRPAAFCAACNRPPRRSSTTLGAFAIGGSRRDCQLSGVRGHRDGDRRLRGQAGQPYTAEP